MTKKEIRDLIAQGKLEKAIKAIEKMAQDQDSDIANTIILQSAQYHQNERNNNMGTITSANYGMTRARITNALLYSLDELEDIEVEVDLKDDDDSPAVPPKTGTVEHKSNTILFLASNPTNTGKLQLSNEFARLSQELQNSEFRAKMERAVTFTNLQKFILREKPRIVHFSGHGESLEPSVKDALRRGSLDIDDEENTSETGIILMSEDLREPFLVGTNVIKHFFKGMVKIQNIPIETVIFNSCHSEAQALAVAEYVPNVIGTSYSVRDDAAIAFSSSFYLGLAQGQNVMQAVSLGMVNAMAYNEPADRFVLYQNGEKVDI
jgi:hypothetical protein